MIPIPRSFRFSALVATLVIWTLAVPAGYAASDLPAGTAKGSFTFDEHNTFQRYATVAEAVAALSR